MMRCISYWKCPGWACPGIVALTWIASPAHATGPYSSGLANNNPGAIDPAVPGFINGLLNPAFVGWATHVESYLPAPSEDTDYSDPLVALGPVTGSNVDVVSLRDLDTDQINAHVPPGQITLKFATGISNAAGADFAVFENALGGQNFVFGELAYVEVSSDGENFARFPGISGAQGQVGEYGSFDPRDVHNLAGKHINAYGPSWGTPFDLSELGNDPSVLAGAVKLNGIRYVRLIDIPGDGSFIDSTGHPIYDAWLTWGSGGFDLEAIGVLHKWLGGDANFDGMVNRADLGILARYWQKSASGWSQGDFTGDGFVNIADMQVMLSHWMMDQTSGGFSGLSSAIPEPAGLWVLGLSVVLVRRARHR